MALKPITQKQAKIEISALQGIFWTSIKGGKHSLEEVAYSDGSTGLELTLAGMGKIEPLTLTKPHDPVNDAAIHNFIKAQAVAKTPFNVTVTPISADIAGSAIPGAKATTYNNCMFLSYTPPQFDRDGTGLARCEMTLAVNSLPTY